MISALLLLYFVLLETSTSYSIKVSKIVEMKALCESCHHPRPHPRQSKTPVLSLVAQNTKLLWVFYQALYSGQVWGGSSRALGSPVSALWACLSDFLLHRGLKVYILLGQKILLVLSYIASSSLWPEFCAESPRCLILMCKCTCIEKNILIRLVFDIQGHCLYCEFKKQEARRKMPKKNKQTNKQKTTALWQLFQNFTLLYPKNKQFLFSPMKSCTFFSVHRWYIQLQLQLQLALPFFFSSHYYFLPPQYLQQPQLAFSPHCQNFCFQTFIAFFFFYDCKSLNRLLYFFFFFLSSVQLLSHAQLFATPWTAACQLSLSITNSQSLLKLMSIEVVMPSNHLNFCHSLLLLPLIFPSIRVFPSELVLCIRWPKYWSFSFNISPSKEYSGLISFRMDCLDLLAVQGTLKSLLQHHSSKASILYKEISL